MKDAPEPARWPNHCAGAVAITPNLWTVPPQTWWEWRHVIPHLAEAGYRVVAPDYRGACASSKPPDIHGLLHGHLEVTGPFTMVGHDIGMMVAYAYASSFPNSTERLLLMEAPLPGTAVYDRMVATPYLANAPMWHFFFHNAQDSLAEALTAGRERLYLKHFYDRLAFDAEAIDPAALDRYAASFEAAGAMRAGFELYRAFDRDGEDNRAALAQHSKLTMPVLGLGGASSFFAPVAEEMLREVAESVTAATIPDCGHWVAEENPRAFLEHVFAFCGTPG